MKKATDFKIGSRVKHTSHGEGIVIAHHALEYDSVLVDFDIEPEGWDKQLFVSADCLKLI